MDNYVMVRHVFIMERLALMIYQFVLCIVLEQLFIAWEFTFTITGAISSACSLRVAKVVRVPPHGPLVGEDARAIFYSQSITEDDYSSGKQCPLHYLRFEY